MEGIERAKLKDSITQWLLDNTGEHFPLHIYLSMGNPVETQAHFDEIIEEMYSEAKKYFSSEYYHGTSIFSSNEFTQKFLDSGGFVAEYDAITEANKKKIESTIRDLKIKKLTEKELEQKITNNKWALPLSIASIIIAGSALGWSIYNGANNVSQEQFYSLQNRLQSLENSIKQINTPIVIDSVQTKE